MADDPTLSPAASEQIASLRSTDIAIGIATHNHADTVGEVIEAVRNALRVPLADVRGVIIHADAGSTDETADRFVGKEPSDAPVLPLTYAPAPGPKLALPNQGIQDKGRALKSILRAAQQLQAKGCVFLDPTLRGVTPEAVAALARPVLDGKFDFVAPYYTRDKFDGLVTSGLLYPLVRAMYGKRLRQPMGGDFAVSTPLAEHFLAQNLWEADKTRISVDLRMVIETISRGFKLGQARVGAMSRVSQGPAADLSATLAQVLTEVFELILRDSALWQRARGSESVPLLGVPPVLPLPPVSLDPQPLIESFTLGYKNLQPIWSMILPPASMLVLKGMGSGRQPKFVFPDKTWARTLYDFALGYRLRTMNRDHLLHAFTPLYLAWVASFATEMAAARPDEAEHRIEALCLAFEAEKPYLISRWRWPDRFNP